MAMNTLQQIAYLRESWKALCHGTSGLDGSCSAPNVQGLTLSCACKDQLFELCVLGINGFRIDLLEAIWPEISPDRLKCGVILMQRQLALAILVNPIAFHGSQQAKMSLTMDLIEV